MENKNTKQNTKNCFVLILMQKKKKKNSEIFQTITTLRLDPPCLIHLKRASLLDWEMFNIFRRESVTHNWFSLIHPSFFLTNSSSRGSTPGLSLLYQPPALSLSLPLFAEWDTCVIDSSPKPVRLDQFAELYPIIKAGLRVRDW